MKKLFSVIGTLFLGSTVFGQVSQHQDSTKNTNVRKVQPSEVKANNNQAKSAVTSDIYIKGSDTSNKANTRKFFRPNPNNEKH
jgi:uncharacterized alpha/beta hydrolase family protein